VAGRRNVRVAGRRKSYNDYQTEFRNDLLETDNNLPKDIETVSSTAFIALCPYTGLCILNRCVHSVFTVRNTKEGSASSVAAIHLEQYRERSAGVSGQTMLHVQCVVVDTDTCTN